MCYRDATAVRASSLDNTDVRVTGAKGFSQLARLVSVNTASDRTSRTATYRITPPGGTWDTADNGSYTVALQANQVSDTSGNMSAATALGAFQVNVPSPPPSTPTGKIFQDDFNSGTLKPGWKWINEVPANWSLSGDPGRLRLKRSTGHGFYRTPATEREQSPVSVLYRDGFTLSDGFEIQLKAGFYNYKMFGQVGFVVFTDVPDTTKIDNYFKFIIEYTFDNEVLQVNFLKETNGVDSRVPADLRGLVWGNKLSVDMKMSYVNGRLVSQIREVGSTQWQDYFDTPANLPQGSAVKVGLWAESDHTFANNGDTEYAWLDDLQITNGKL
jgi:Beta xylosidase C-terminal Concanavalin A-like domain